jgi:hypothetical protein
MSKNAQGDSTHDRMKARRKLAKDFEELADGPVSRILCSMQT